MHRVMRGLDMNEKRQLPSWQAIIFILFSVISVNSIAHKELPQLSYDGLELVNTKKMNAVYRRPEADFSVYDQVIILNCEVAFRKNWKRDQNAATRSPGSRITDADMAKIRTNLGELCRDVFTEELQRDGGYQITNTPGEGVMVVRPNIVNLDISAPDKMTAGRSRTFTTSAGSMTLFLEAFDSVSGEIIGRVIDSRKAPDSFRMQWTNSVTNVSEGKRIIRRWGQTLREMLDYARQSGKPVPAAGAAE